MTSQEKIAELRDTIREILRYRNYDEGGVIEEDIIAIVSAARLAFTSEDEQPRRRGTEAAMFAGLNRIETIKAKLYDRFRLNYPWNTKQGSDMLDFLSSRPENETVDAFATWYWSDPWRREKKGPPSLTEIYTMWPLAFSTPEYGGTQIPIFRGDEENQ